MSDERDEAAGVGAADPITGVTGGGDDLASSAQLPDGDDGAADFAAGDLAALAAESAQTVTNDAVAGETVLPGEGDGNDGPTGGAPTEASPILPDNELDADAIDLEDER